MAIGGRQYEAVQQATGLENPELRTDAELRRIAAQRQIATNAGRDPDAPAPE